MASEAQRKGRRRMDILYYCQRCQLKTTSKNKFRDHICKYNPDPVTRVPLRKGKVK